MHPGAFQKHGENSGLAAEIKKHVKTRCAPWAPLSRTRWTLLADGHADCIAVGRALIADPFLPKKLLRGQAQDITPCLRCGECQSGMMKNRVLRCAVNPVIGREDLFFLPFPPITAARCSLPAAALPGFRRRSPPVSQGHQVVLR